LDGKIILKGVPEEKGKKNTPICIRLLEELNPGSHNLVIEPLLDERKVNVAYILHS